MSENSSDSVARIRHLNDAFRRTFVGGAVVVTAVVEALPTAKRKAILAKVRAFDAFTEDYDPRPHDHADRRVLTRRTWARGSRSSSSAAHTPSRSLPRPSSLASSAAREAAGAVSRFFHTES